jgi:hypothetical protein
MLRRVLLATVGLCGAVTVGALAWASRTDDLKERLIREARAAYASPLRKPHVDPPADGSFGQRIEAVLAPLDDAARRFSSLPREVQDACVDVRKGKRPVSELPAQCRTDLFLEGKSVQTVLDATHSTRVDFPAPMQALRAEYWGPHGQYMLGLPYAAKLVALDLFERQAGHESELGYPGLPVDECVDGLAIARDAAYGQGVGGVMVGSTIDGILFDGCGTAIDDAGPLEAPRVLRGILRIREATKPFEAVMREESVFASTAFAGRALPEAELSDLPPEAREFIPKHPAQLDWWMTPLPALAWRTFDQEHERWYAALTLPRRERVTKLLQFQDACARSWNPIRRGNDTNMGSYYRRYLRGLERLETLAAAAVARSFWSGRGRWPTEEELQVAIPGLEQGEIKLTPGLDQMGLALPDDGERTDSIVVHVEH